MTIIRYLTRLYVERLMLLLVGLAALLQLVDLMDRADDVLERGFGVLGLMRYGLLRLPLTAGAAVPVAALAAAVLTFATLAARGEITALRAAGLPVLRLAGLMLPVAAVLGLGHLLLADWLQPRADAAFARWWGEGAAGRIWFADGLDVVGVERVEGDGTLLAGIEITRRQPDGGLADVLTARQAQFSEGRWALLQGNRMSAAGPSQPFERLPWPTRLEPANLLELTRPMPVLSMSRLNAALKGGWAVRDPKAAIVTRLLRLAALPVMPMLMVLLASPVVAATRRGGGIPAGMAVGLAAGLSYLLLDGILAAMGEAGTLPPPLAAWMAHGVFACVGGAFLLHAEG
jgi:lipopolysaccharide export system permease protein